MPTLPSFLTYGSSRHLELVCIGAMVDGHMQIYPKISWVPVNNFMMFSHNHPALYTKDNEHGNLCPMIVTLRTKRVEKRRKSKVP